MTYKTYTENAAEEILAEDGARIDYISEAYGPSAIDPEYEAYCDSDGDDTDHLDIKANRLAYEKEVKVEAKEAYEKALAAEIAEYGGPIPF